MDRNIYTDEGKIDTNDAVWEKFRKKPIVITAIQMNVPFRVETMEGWMVGKEGDWLIRGIKGELYPCDDEIFRMTYELAK